MEEFKVFGLDRHRINIDGKGVITLVGLSGCPLNCEYCINKRAFEKFRVKTYSVEQLVNLIMQDYCYYIATGGGVTFGGGEPLLQYKAIKKFADIIPKDIAINVETSLNVESENLSYILGSVTRFIIDIKDMNELIYERYTGINNSKLLQNLRLITEEELQDRCVVRVPLIKGYNTQSDIEGSKKILNSMGFKDIDAFEYIIKS